jgi:hypothetical protein
MAKLPWSIDSGIRVVQYHASRDAARQLNASGGNFSGPATIFHTRREAASES